MLIESVLAVLTSMFSGMSFKKYFNIGDKVKSNWSSLQCTTVGSWLYPFFGPKSVSITDNQAHCESGKFNSMFDVSFSAPMKNLSKLGGITSKLTGTINEIRKKISSVEQNIFKDLNGIWQRLWSVYIRITQVFMVLFQIVQKLLILLVAAITILKDAYCTLGSTWNGPIGDAGRYFCFDKNTKIQIKNGLKSIHKLKVGNKLADENYVKAKFKFSTDGVEMYNYKGVIVSGSHLVLENSVWIRVNTSKFAKIIAEDENPRYIYCIETTDNKIRTKNNILFADYEETLDNDVNLKMMKHIFSIINKDYKFQHNKFYLPGLTKDSLILMDDLTYKSINKINIGDILADQSKVIGTVIRGSEKIPLYEYKGYVLSGMDIIKENSKWITVADAITSKISPNRDRYLYHIQTNNDKFITKNFEIRSFMPLSDSANDHIDEMIEEHLNTIDEG